MALQTLSKLGSSSYKKPSTSIDLSNPAVRQAIAEQLGVSAPKPKANILSRLTSALSAFETGNAVYKALESGNLGTGLTTYLGDVLGGISGAFTGNVNKDKKTYKDVAEKLGVKNKLLKGAIGFVGDVALDPTTYVTVGAGKGIQVGGKTLTKSGEKVFKEGVEKANIQLGKEVLEKGAEMGAKSFVEKAAKQGIVLSAMNKGPRELAMEFAEKRLTKFMDKTGAKLTQEGAEALGELGLKAGEELAQKSAFRFAGKKVFGLEEGLGKLGLKSYFDPISTATELAAKTPLGKVIKKDVGQMLFPVRRLFSRSAELAGEQSIEKQYKGLIQETLQRMDMSRFVGTQAEGAAKEAYKNIMSAGQDPVIFNYIFEGTPKSIVDKLPDDTKMKIYAAMGDIKMLMKGEMSNNAILKGVERTTAAPLSNIMLEDATKFMTGEATPEKLQGLKDLYKLLPSDKTSETVRGFIKDTLSQKYNFNVKDLDDLVAFKAVTKTAEEYKNNLFKMAQEYPDPIKTAEDKLLSSNKNIGQFVDLTTKMQMMADERTAILKNAGLIEGVDKPYMMRRLAAMPGEEMDEIAQDLYKYGSGQAKNLTKKRTFDFLAEGELAGYKYTTTGKLGKDAAVELANNIGHTQALFAKAAIWDDFQKTAVNFKDEIGNNIFVSAEEAGADAIKRGLYKQVKSPLTGQALFSGMYAPKEVTDIIDKTHKAFFSDKGTQGFVKMFDKVQSLWKKSVTSYFPAFHVRNAASNVFANTMSDVTDITTYVKAKDVQKFANDIMKYGMDSEQVKKWLGKEVGRTGFKFKEFLDLAEKNGIVGSGTFWNELEKADFDVSKGILSKINPTNFGNFVEENAKLAHFIDRLNKGWGIDDAVLSVKKTLFDYGDLTDFEKNVLRRVVPFYTWARKNAELQLSMIAHQPGKYATVLKGFRDIQDAFTELPDEDIEKLPDWVKSGVQIVRGKDGTANVIYGFGTPIEAFSQFAGSFIPGITGETSVLSSLSPLLKTGLELGFDKSTFSGKTISTDTNAKQLKGILSKLPEPIKNLIKYQEIERTTRTGEKYTEYLMDPMTKYILNTLLGRTVSTAGKLTAGENFDITAVDLLTGLKRKSFNIAEEEEKRQQELEKALYNELVKQGLAKSYTSTYLTSDAKEKLNY